MTREDLVEIVNRQPFKPFVLYLSDGTQHDVRHPDAIAVARRVAYIVLPSEPNRGDRFADVVLHHITKVEHEEPSVTGD